MRISIGSDGEGRAEPPLESHRLLLKSGKEAQGELTLKVGKVERSGWIPGDLKSMRAEMARIFAVRNEISAVAVEEEPSSDEDSDAVMPMSMVPTGNPDCPRPAQLMRHAFFYWGLLIGGFLLRLMSVPGAEPCIVGGGVREVHDERSLLAVGAADADQHHVRGAHHVPAVYVAALGV